MSKLEDNFISATKEYNDIDSPVPSPYIRKSFKSQTECSGIIRRFCI